MVPLKEMPQVRVYEHDGEYQVVVGGNGFCCETLCWVFEFDAIYTIGVIAAMARLWPRAGYMSCSLRAIQRAVYRAVGSMQRHQMWFLHRAHSRAIVALRCIYWLPRDLLREIYAHLCVDDAERLFELFSGHVCLRYVSGLYLRTAGTAMAHRPWLHVDEVQAYVSRVNPIINYIYIEDGRRVLSYMFHFQCVERQTPHFCVKDLNSRRTLPIEFSSDEAIEFIADR